LRQLHKPQAAQVQGGSKTPSVSCRYDTAKGKTERIGLALSFVAIPAKVDPDPFGLEWILIRLDRVNLL
jgi:hypothetical protein